MTKTEAKTRGGEVTVRPAVGTRTWQGYREQDQAQLRGLPGATDSAVRKINAVVVRKVRQKSWEQELRASDLDDLVQEVHINLIERLRKPRDGKTSGRAISSYINKILLGVISDYRRSLRRHPSHDPANAVEPDTQMQGHSGSGIRRAADAKSVSNLIWRAWNEVKRSWRGKVDSLEIFESVVLLGQGIHEVARSFKKTEGAVRKNNSILLGKLRRQFRSGRPGKDLRPPTNNMKPKRTPKPRSNSMQPGPQAANEVESPELEVIGEGGFASVYGAKWRDTAVAVKKLTRNETPEDRTRFEREVDTLLQLTRFGHRFIVPLLSYDLNDDPPWFSMPRAPLTLANLLKKVRPDPDVEFYQRLRIFFHVLEAVEFAHRHGVIHRDLKPANILLFPDHYGYTARVADFGICRRQNAGDPQITRSGCCLGTDRYQPPEQRKDPENVSAGSDIFPLGIILQEILEGGQGFTNQLTRHGWNLVNRCTMACPEDRYQSVEQLRDHLWLSLENSVASPPPLSADYRYFLTRELGLHGLFPDGARPDQEASFEWLNEETTKAQAASMIKHLKSEHEKRRMSFLVGLPTLHHRDIKYLIKYQFKSFATLVEACCAKAPVLRYQRADERADFYMTLTRYALEFHGLRRKGCKDFVEKIAGCMDELARTTRRHTVRQQNEELQAELVKARKSPTGKCRFGSEPPNNS